MPIPPIDYKLVIPSEYQIPEEILGHTVTFIAQKMPKKKTGRPRRDNKPLLAGMYYVLRTGCPWEALPLCFGAAKTVYHRFREFIRFGVFQDDLANISSMLRSAKGLSLKHQSVDSNHRKSPLGGEKRAKVL